MKAAIKLKVDPVREARLDPRQLSLYGDSHEEELRRIAEAVSRKSKPSAAPEDRE